MTLSDEQLLLQRATEQGNDAPTAAHSALAKATISEARLAANRANALRSTGPKTEQGKAISSKNSFKHGLYAKAPGVPGEDPAELEALKADLLAEHLPATITEKLLINELAEHYWRMKRYRRLETVLLNGNGFATGKIALAQQFMTATERSFHKCLKALIKIRRRCV